MSAEKPPSHHAAAWLMRAGAAIAIGGGAVSGLQYAGVLHAEQAPVIDISVETQAQHAADLAAGIALAGLIPFTAGGSWRLAQRQR